MKGNKKILSEISRIHEIMGISKPLLNESIWDDLFKAGVKNADEAIVIGGKKVPDELAVAIRNSSKQIDDGVVTVKKGIDDVLKVARTSAPELVDELIDRIVNHPKVADTFISMTDDAAKSVRNLVDQGKSLPDAIKQVEEVYGPVFRNSDTLPNEIYRRFWTEVTDEVGDYKPKPKVDGETSTPGDDAAKSGDEVVDDAATLTDEFPEENSMTLEDGEKVSDIFDESKWNENFTDVDATVARKLMNEEWWAPFVEFFQNIVKSSQQRVVTIQKIAKALETTTDASVKTALQNRLKRELKSLFKSDSKNFVNLRTYLDDVAVNSKEWKKIWNNIKSKSNGGWDFWKSIGEVAQYDSKLNNLRKVLTDGYSYVFKMWGDMSTNPIKLFQKGISKELKDSIRKNLSNVIRSGTKRGWPTMANELYTDVIKKYGLKSARAIYVRDLLLNTIKINFLINFLPTTVGALSSWYLREDVKSCLVTNNIESETCKSLTDSRWSRFLLKRALGYRGLDELDADIDYFSALIKNSIPFMGDNKINWNDEGWLQATEIVAKDPGYVGDVVNLFFEINDLISNPTTQDQLNVFLQSEMSELENQLDTVETELEQAAEEERQGSGEENQTSTEDNNTDQETLTGTVESVADKLGVNVDEITKEGDVFIWSMDGEEIGKYKIINGELKIQ